MIYLVKQNNNYKKSNAFNIDINFEISNIFLINLCKKYLIKCYNIGLYENFKYILIYIYSF